MENVQNFQSYQKNAKIAGFGFLAAIVTGVLGLLALPTLKEDASDLADIISNESTVLFGAIFTILMAISIATIAISLYPVLRRYNEGVALTAVAFRLIESIFFLIYTALALSLLSLSKEFVNAGSPADSSYQILAKLLVSGGVWVGLIAGIAFNIGALMYTYLFFKENLIPRGLAILGLVAISFALVDTVLVMYGVYGDFDMLSSALDFITLIYELILAIWLIKKGFNFGKAV